jgi:hypothetical protein
MNRLCSSNSRSKGAECDTASALRWYRNRYLCNLPSVDMVVADLYFRTAIHHGRAWLVEVCLQLGMIVSVSVKACEFFTSARCCSLMLLYVYTQRRLADVTIFKLPVRHPAHIVSHRYRPSDSACRTSCSQGPSPHAGRASLNHQKEVCVSGQTRQASLIRKPVCSYYTTEGEFAIRLK